MKRLIIILFFTATIINAQAENKYSQIDSLKLENKYNLLLKSSNKTLPLFSLKNIADPYALQFETTLLENSSQNIYELNSFTMQRIKNDISNSFKIFRSGQKKYHLGVVSDILGYTNAAAAVGLGIYHLIKYKKKYGIK